VLETDKENIVQYAHYGYVYCMLLAKGLTQGDRDEEVLISGGGDGTIKLWQLGKESHSGITELATLEIGDTSVLSMAMDGILLYSGRLEGDINVWDLDARQLIQTVKAYNSDILTIAVGYGMVFTGGADSHAKVRVGAVLLAFWANDEDRSSSATSVRANGKPTKSSSWPLPWLRITGIPFS
jgi:di- and tripeptidase